MQTVPEVDIVIPVYNEEAGLAASVGRLYDFLTNGFPYAWRITIADNASVDRTLDVAHAVQAELPGVDVVHLDRKGRGRALRETWSASDAPVVAYMDVDLSTDLSALLPLVAPLVENDADVAIGSRLARGSKVTRGFKREVISRAYNKILKTYSGATFSDAQCGFKAARQGAAALLMPLIEDTGWFFDTEMLLLAQHFGLRIHEVPVTWVDDPDSRVAIISTALDDLRGIRRMKRTLATTTASADRFVSGAATGTR